VGFCLASQNAHDPSIYCDPSDRTHSFSCDPKGLTGQHGQHAWAELSPPLLVQSSNMASTGTVSGDWRLYHMCITQWYCVAQCCNTRTATLHGTRRHSSDTCRLRQSPWGNPSLHLLGLPSLNLKQDLDQFNFDRAQTDAHATKSSIAKGRMSCIRCGLTTQPKKPVR